MCDLELVDLVGVEIFLRRARQVSPFEGGEATVKGVRWRILA
jgi:hypothetical protein